MVLQELQCGGAIGNLQAALDKLVELLLPAEVWLQGAELANHSGPRKEKPPT
ncbi:hypothetical protein NCCP691_30360 [Noviherbaspirillum aridicola]|uniref:Uncharacterized protein n=1 Tax=Noviherbaspirillum aridicola TaxID=2849687 RepID=A0ABQ4Q721_9BURK|nr:hypothetical protein NCCP691_30360 [Noviherbaspirillum aridicola]